MVNYWDSCRLEPSFLASLEEAQQALRASASAATSASPDDASESPLRANQTVPSADSNHYYHQLEASMAKAEASCHSSLAVLDAILATTSSVSSAFEDVTGRTNSLVARCESLLEQQHTLQNTVEVLQKTLQPFNDIEEIAATLGIPYDNSSAYAKLTPRTTGGNAFGNSSSNSNGSISILNSGGGGGAGSRDHQLSASNIDPRSPEFLDILKRLSQAIAFLKKNRDIHDCAKYMSWLEKLQTRATSLIGRAMRDLLDKAYKQCKESTIPSDVESPLEANPLYTKFRGLSYRMKELTSVLIKGHLLDSMQSADNSAHVDHSVLLDCRKYYCILRGELLLQEVKSAWLQSLRITSLHHSQEVSSSSTDLAQFIPDLASPTAVSSNLSAAAARPSSSSATASNAGAASASQVTSREKPRVTLGNAVRQAFAVLLRVAQLEAQLYDSLFSIDPAAQAAVSSPHSPRPAPSASQEELRSVVEGLSISVRDMLRPLIIREQSLDELCQLISSLNEDMLAQIAALHLLLPLQTILSTHCQHLLNDAKERLLYVAQVKLRTDVQMFVPLPSQLDYPGILLEASSPNNGDSQGGSSRARRERTVYDTWYPPLRHTLSLLSKLYNLIDPVVFEDLAMSAVKTCIEMLSSGAVEVKRRNNSNHLHGDLFLIRHLLLLREQLQPFDMKLQMVERVLDFSSTSTVLQQLLTPRTGLGTGRGANAGVGLGASPRNGNHNGGFFSFSDDGGSVASQAATTPGGLKLSLTWDRNLPSQLLSLAQLSTPSMSEVRVDMRKELDASLRSACIAMKASACKLLLGPMDAFLAKVAAFIGDIPYDTSETPSGRSSGGASEKERAVRLSSEQQIILRGQAFAKEERIKEVVDQVQQLMVQRLPDFKTLMNVYIDNNVARHVLLKPIVQEILICRRRMDTVVHSLLDGANSGSALKREIEQALHAIAYTVSTELSNS